ncbi:MAG TPA: hypothetical protein VHV27_02500 [Phenylobacterium sp.]|nr:hypothetical protein [Phenylobacterium sp.]
MAVKAPSDDVKRVISLALDAAFYRSAYAEAGEVADPLAHYSGAGWRDGRDPAPWFSTSRYLAVNSDVAQAGAEPLHHYLTVGRYEGRDVYPSERAQAYFAARRTAGEMPGWSFEALLAAARPEPSAPPAPPAGVRSPPDHRELAAAEFDAAFYLGMNPDVGEAGADPLDHFLVTGWREGRDPTAWFSVRDYLEAYPDIVQAGENPFVHYLLAGRAEGRVARHELGFRYEILSNLMPVERRVAMAVEATAEVQLGSAGALEAALAGARRGLGDLHLTFSHDDYSTNLGGVQLCLQREAARIAALGRDHLHLYPAKFWPVVRKAGERGALGLVWNGKAIGAYAPKTVAAVLARLAGEGRSPGRSFAIHSLLGHGAAETTRILAAVGLTRGFFWLHDFASLCAGFHLLRDDVEDCAAPPPDSPACGICVYGPWRDRHLAEHARLFKALQLTVVSPSASALELWRASAAYPTQGEVVLPHVRLVERGPAPVARTERPLRVAFAGAPAPHKGWAVFRELVLRHAEDPRYEFHHFGAQPPAGLPLAFHPISAGGPEPQAMRRGLEAAGIDAALIWPLCRETFSFTAHEAVAAGAAVITNPDSGNVAAFVGDGGHGAVLADETALAAAFETGDILALARAGRRPKLYDLEMSALTMDLIAPKPPAPGLAEPEVRA